MLPVKGQSVQDSIVEEQILDESETVDPIQTYAEEDIEETQSDFLYIVLDDGTAEITGYQGDEKGDLIIPTCEYSRNNGRLVVVAKKISE